MRSFLLSVTLACIVFPSFGQVYNIHGSVRDTLLASPMYLSSVVLIRSTDSVIESFTRTAENGTFTLSAHEKGKYILQISFPGFADYVDIVNVNDALTELGAISMSSKEHLLKEFVLTQQVAAIKIKGDTTEYMADSFKLKENATVEDLLKKLPGIQVDKNGQVIAQGETVQKILVDGEEFFSDDPKVVTQGLQADAITKVQVYDKKSDQAEFTGIDDGQKTKTINLQLKENRKRGYFGKEEAGGGTDGYFQQQLMLNAFKGKRQLSLFGIASNTDKVGLGWQDNDKYGSGNGILEQIDDNSWRMYGGGYDDFAGWDGKYNGDGLPKVWTSGVHFANRWHEDKDHVSASYRYAKQNVETDGNNSSIMTLAGDSSRVNTEHKIQFNTAERHGLNGLLEWAIDSNTSLKMTLNGGEKETKTASIYHTETYYLVKDTAGAKTINDRTITADSKRQFVEANLLFRKKFAKKGRTLSADFTTDYDDTKGNGFLTSTTSGPVVTTPNLDEKKINNISTLAAKGKVTYTEPLSKVAFLDGSYSLAVDNSSALNSSYDKTPASSDYSTFRDTISSDYDYNILTNRGGLNLKFVYKKLNWGFGSDVSNTSYLQTDRLHGDTSHTYNYVNFYPSANFTYKFAKQTSFKFSYRGNTKQPTIEQIQPLKQNTDPLNLTVGNPGLKQEFDHNFSVNFNDYKVLSQRYLYSHLSFEAKDNAIGTSQTINGPVSTTQYVNVSGNYTANWYVNYGLKLKKPELGIGISFEGNNNRLSNYVNGEKNVSTNAAYTVGPELRYEKEEKYEFSLNPSVTYNVNTSTINIGATNYWVFNTQFEGMFMITKKFEIGSSVNVMHREKTIVFTTNNDVVKWNAYVSHKFLKKNQLELKAAVYDILNQNVGYTRTAQGNVITQNNYNTIRRYGMLSLIWNFTHNPASATNEQKDK